jgi:curved DNA-binding protein CbpA
MTDLYEELGVKRNADAAAIKAAGKRVAKETHPDRPGGGDPERFARSRRALAVLSDPAAREHYDRTGDDGGGRSKLEDPVAMILIQALEAALSKLIDEDPEYFDLPAGMRERLDAQIAQGEEAQEGIAEAQAKLEELAARLSFNGEGPDVIGDRIRDKLRQNAANREENARKLGEHREALARLDAWTYRLDKRPETGRGIFGDGPSFADLSEAIDAMARDRYAQFVQFGTMPEGGPRPFVPPRYDMPRGKK